jgi:hypothetical protein
VLQGKIEKQDASAFLQGDSIVTVTALIPSRFVIIRFILGLAWLMGETCLLERKRRVSFWVTTNSLKL